MPLLLSAGALLSGFATIASDYAGFRRGVYVAKPLTLALLLGLAFFLAPHGFVRNAIVLGLALSLAGDVFLMLDKQRWFRHGLASFLVAHLAYIAAFGFPHGYTLSVASTAPLLLAGATYYAYLFPHLARDRWPVLAYLIVIGVMAAQAIEQALQAPNMSSLSAAAGAVLFLLSDSCLAWNRFVKTFASAQAVILSTYFLAQWLIVLSLA